MATWNATMAVAFLTRTQFPKSSTASGARFTSASYGLESGTSQYSVTKWQLRLKPLQSIFTKHHKHCQVKLMVCSFHNHDDDFVNG